MNLASNIIQREISDGKHPIQFTQLPNKRPTRKQIYASKREKRTSLTLQRKTRNGLFQYIRIICYHTQFSMDNRKEELKGEKSATTIFMSDSQAGNR